MIDNYVSTFSDNFSVAILMWPLFSLLLTLPFLVILYRRDGWLALGTIFAIYAAILYAIGLICFTLYPLPSGSSGPGITYGIEPILNPLNFVNDISKDGTKAVFQLVFNIVLFVPLGFIAKTLLKLKFPFAILLALVCTCLIETAQLTGLFGMYPFAFRTFDVDDIICNTLGGVIGWMLGYLADRLIMKDSTEPPAITHDPKFLRRCITFWTDAMIIDFCFVIPRIILFVGMKLLLGSTSDTIDASDSVFGGSDVAVSQMSEIASMACFIIAFIVVEIIVPWRNGGSTPAGMFYRMSCETKERSGILRVAFYAVRSVVLFALLIYLRYLLLPLLLFYLIARKMPYDLIPNRAQSSSIETCE